MAKLQHNASQRWNHTTLQNNAFNMEHTKESLIGTLIQVKSVAHAAKIVAFYKSFGYFKRTPIEYNFQKQDIGGYIGVYCEINENAHLWWPGSFGTEMKIIKLPVKPRLKFPREMMVSDHKEGPWLIKRMVYAKIKHASPYIATIGSYPVNAAFAGWKFAKEIDN